MKLLGVFQLIWAAILLLFFTFRIISTGSLSGYWVIAIYLIYFIGAIYALKRSRIGWAICIIMPIVMLVRFAPRVIMSFWMYMKGDPSFVDAPATILISFAVGIAFVLPALIIFSLQIRQRLQILKIIEKRLG